MSLWKTIGIALAVAVAAMLIVPHVPFLRDLVQPKPAK